MATVSNATGALAGIKRDPYGSEVDNGTDFTPEDEQGVSIFRMRRVGIGIRNYGTSDVTVLVVPVTNDIAKPVTVIIPAGQRFSDFRFNCIIVTGSTGHDLATTYYIYE